MDIAAHIDALEHEGLQLADAASTAALGDPVPGCPDWAVGDLLRHIGYVHRWAAAIVAGRLDGVNGDGDAAVGPLPDDAGLLAWYGEGHRALVETLRHAPADVECFTFLPAPSPLAFWARRQALETAVHRADAAAAAGSVAEFSDELAHDGIDETLRGFGARPRAFEPGSIWLQPGDGTGWRIDLHEQGAASSTDGAADGCDVTISGTPTQVYLWLWNRPATVEISGDATVADRWKRVRVRWS
ncbi:MAG TPA: maleylpyruvate isomerase family mycothiol-dependent enzyme [Mycobacteriales bacterium]|nr:maleylpyruvate isomerase family mycothiol-dependent enzyme [Mycobacteriales bacterium]